MKHFPLYSIHKKAEIAHMASECVLEIQNKEKFYEYVDLIFENQNNMLKSNLKNLAYSLGVEKDRFDKCLDSDSKKDNVRKEYEEGLEKGVGATPTFFVNGKKVSFPDLESEIKNILNKTNE